MYCAYVARARARGWALFWRAAVLLGSLSCEGEGRAFMGRAGERLYFCWRMAFEMIAFVGGCWARSGFGDTVGGGGCSVWPIFDETWKWEVSSSCTETGGTS